MRLAGNFGGYITVCNSDAQLTIENQTIKGYGQIGLTNFKSSIRQRFDSRQQSERSRSRNDRRRQSRAVNQGIMRAADSGDLRFNDTELDNTNGIIESQATSEILFDGSTIRGGQLLGDGQFTVVSDSLFEDVELGSTLVGSIYSSTSKFAATSSIRAISLSTIRLVVTRAYSKSNLQGRRSPAVALFNWSVILAVILMAMLCRVEADRSDDHRSPRAWAGPSQNRPRTWRNNHDQRQFDDRSVRCR